MSTNAELVTRLRGMVHEPDDTHGYTDDVLTAFMQKYPLVDSFGEPPFVGTAVNSRWALTYDMHRAAADIWEEKAVAKSHLYQFSDGKGSFSRQQIYKQFMQNVNYHLSRRQAGTGRAVRESAAVSPVGVLPSGRVLTILDIDTLAKLNALIGDADLISSTDARLTDSRDPNAHASSHASGGGDALAPADIGAAESVHTHNYEASGAVAAHVALADPHEQYQLESNALGLGETASDAYRGDRGRVAYDHSQVAHAPSGAEANPAQASAAEISAAIATVLRSYSPADIKAFIDAHAAGGGDFADGGEAGGANRSLGNSDLFSLALLTNAMERLFIKESGEVGIGTSTPDRILSIKNNGNELDIDPYSYEAKLTGHTASGYTPKIVSTAAANFYIGRGSHDAFTNGIKFGTYTIEIMPNSYAYYGAIATFNGYGLAFANGKSVQVDTIKAKDSDGLTLHDDGGNGIKILDGGGVEMEEISDPAAGAANSARLFARDNGSGKTQLCVRFSSGAIQVLATEP